MQATGIVEALDVSEQVPPGLGPGGVDPVMDPLGLEGVEEALRVLAEVQLRPGAG